MENIKAILSEFNLTGEIKEVQAITLGLINTTYRVIFEDGGQYTLQAINTNVFKEPEKLMENVAGVTDHVRAKLIASGGDPDRETLTVIKTKDGKAIYIDKEGRCWRTYIYIDDARTYDQIEKPELMYEAGYGFGNFQKMLADYDMDKLHETIPNFHNTKMRFETLFKAVEEDKAGRAASVQEEIQFFKDHYEDACLFVNMLAAGEIPLRVTHNDTKINNILIDDATDKALCVIDLDTVMPGIAPFDFGDSIRFAGNKAAEDETDLSKVGIDMELYRQYVKGFLDACGKDLTDAEITHLPHGAKIITLETGARFLTDYLDGDVYFKTKREGHNLDRARCQMQHVRSMEENFEEMCRIIEECR